MTEEQFRHYCGHALKMHPHKLNKLTRANVQGPGHPPGGSYCHGVSGNFGGPWLCWMEGRGIRVRGKHSIYLGRKEGLEAVLAFEEFEDTPVFDHLGLEVLLEI